MMNTQTSNANLKAIIAAIHHVLAQLFSRADNRPPRPAEARHNLAGLGSQEALSLSRARVPAFEKKSRIISGAKLNLTRR